MTSITTKQIMVPRTEIMIKDDKKIVVVILEEIDNEILMEENEINLSWTLNPQAYRNFYSKRKELGLDKNKLTEEERKKEKELEKKMLKSSVTLEYSSEERCKEAFGALTKLIKGSQGMRSLGSFQF
jgi:hypothetical protein